MQEVWASGQGAKTPHALGPKNQSIKQKQYGNKFNKDFKNGPDFLKKIFKDKEQKMDWLKKSSIQE